MLTKTFLCQRAEGHNHSPPKNTARCPPGINSRLGEAPQLTQTRLLMTPGPQAALGVSRALRWVAFASHA